MSVINQMLHDLESRRSQINSDDTFSYHNLSFIPRLSNSNKLETLTYGVILFLVLISAVFFIVKINNENIATPTVGVENTPVFQETVVDPISTKKNISIKKISEYEVATSVIHPDQKVVIKKILPKKTIISHQATNYKAKSSSNTNSNNKVYKRQRELTATQKAKNLYQSGYKYILTGNALKAQEELRNALIILPGHNKSRELLAGIYIKNGQIVEARTLLQYGMRISPAHTIYAKLYARILMDQNDIVRAISVLLRNPPAIGVDADYHALLAALYQKNKQHQQAATVYSKLLKLRDTNGVWWLGMAISLEALGNKSQAMLAYDKAKKSGNLGKGLAQYTDQRVIALKEIAYP